MLSGLVAMLGLWIGGIVDAYRVVARSVTSTGPWIRWGTVLALLVANALVAPADLSRRAGRTFIVTSGSMLPALHTGDRLVASTYRGNPVELGQVVVYLSPVEESLLVQRVVALAGDTIEMVGWQLHVNGQTANEPELFYSDRTIAETHPWMSWQKEFLVASDTVGYRPTTQTWGPVVVPDDHFFVLGDHRDTSLDSRYLGFVSSAQMVGTARNIIWSRDPETGRVRWDRMGGGI